MTTNEPPEGTGEPDPKPPTDPPADDGLSEAERLQRADAALSSERDARRKADTARKRAEDELEKLRRQGMDDTERQVAEAKAAGRAEAMGESNQRLLRAEVRALAAAKLADPADAVRLLDVDEFHVDDDGSIDGKAIAAAIDKLVEDKPYLAKTNGAPPTPRAPQGTRGTPGSPAGATGETDGDTFLRNLMKQ